MNGHLIYDGSSRKVDRFMEYFKFKINGIGLDGLVSRDGKEEVLG